MSRNMLLIIVALLVGDYVIGHQSWYNNYRTIYQQQFQKRAQDPANTTPRPRGREAHDLNQSKDPMVLCGETLTFTVKKICRGNYYNPEDKLVARPAVVTTSGVRRFKKSPYGRNYRADASSSSQQQRLNIYAPIVNECCRNTTGKGGACSRTQLMKYCSRPKPSPRTTPSPRPARKERTPVSPLPVHLEPEPEHPGEHPPNDIGTGTSATNIIFTYFTKPRLISFVNWLTSQSGSSTVEDAQFKDYTPEVPTVRPTGPTQVPWRKPAYTFAPMRDSDELDIDRQENVHNSRTQRNSELPPQAAAVEIDDAELARLNALNARHILSSGDSGRHNVDNREDGSGDSGHRSEGDEEEDVLAADKKELIIVNTYIPRNQFSDLNELGEIISVLPPLVDADFGS